MRNCPVEMKKSFTNPAKKQVLPAENDSALKVYIRELACVKPLSQFEEREIAQRAAEGDESAKQKLIQANLKLVITIAQKAIHMSNVPLIDLIQEGNLGLMVAAEKFNWKLGYKFSTYASWWIKQSMFKAISEQGHCMKIPVYIQETLSKFSKVKSDMEKTSNKQVSNSEVAEKMNISSEKIDTYLNAFSKSVSLEGGFENEDGKETSLADIIADDKSSVNEAVEYESLKNDIEMIVSTLKEREQNVVRMRYGLGSTSKKTLEEIGNMYGVTKECIRQTELRALKKMKTQGENVLSCYID